MFKFASYVLCVRFFNLEKILSYPAIGEYMATRRRPGGSAQSERFAGLKCHLVARRGDCRVPPFTIDDP